MADKTLKAKAIDIKGKKYVLVSDRVAYFNEQYPNGSIKTFLISEPTSEMIIVRAMVTPDESKDTQARFFTGHSQAVIGDGMVNKTAALENAETSAVGRALGMMGIGVIESIASADEMHKSTTNTMKLATPKQIAWIRDEARKLNDQLRDDEEVDKFIESILTVKPAQIPVFKVKDAIDKLKSEAGNTPAPDYEGGAPIEVTDEMLEKVQRGEIDY